MSELLERAIPIALRSRDRADDLGVVSQALLDSRGDVVNAEVAARMPPKFAATHRHAEGGLYQVLDRTIQVQINGIWFEGVRYRNAEGREFVRDSRTFEGRFKPLRAKGERNG